MARRGKRKKGYSKRKNRKRVSAGKRAYKKSGLYKYNMRRKRGKGRKRKGKGRKASKKYKGRKSSKKSRAYVRKASAAGVRVVPKSKIQDAYRRIIDRGGSVEHANKVVARLERMRMHQIRVGIHAHDAAQKAAAERKKAQDFADVFRKIAAEEKRRAAL